MITHSAPRAREPKHGAVARVLHWATVLVLLAQYVVGYAMIGAEGVLEPWIEVAYGGDEDLLLPVHVAIGCTLIALVLVRAVWRRLVTLPPWPPTLSDAGRRFASLTERALYVLLFVTPSTGLALVLLSGEEWETGDRSEWTSPWDLLDDDLLVGIHVTCQILLLGAIALHVGFVLTHQFVHRDRMLRRML